MRYRGSVWFCTTLHPDVAGLILCLISPHAIFVTWEGLSFCRRINKHVSYNFEIVLICQILRVSIVLQLMASGFNDKDFLCSSTEVVVCLFWLRCTLKWDRRNRSVPRYSFVLRKHSCYSILRNRCVINYLSCVHKASDTSDLMHSDCGTDFLKVELFHLNDAFAVYMRD